MEARMPRALLLLGVLLCTMGARHATPNFVVETADPQLAVRFAQAAEQYRREMALSWLGQTMPDWAQPCQMTVTVGPHLGAGGATTFVFDRGEVYGWRMNIQGSAERVLDSVLPHEVTHMVFASHFRQPVPRWADEGGATSVEADIEKSKHRRMLIQFLQTNRGIAFNTMFAMTQYPPDVMPLYAQGYSLSEYLIQQGGRRKFVEFLGDGMQTGNWQAAVERHYNQTDLGVLQNTWLAWVSQGSPALTAQAAPQPAQPAQPVQPATMVAASSATRPQPNLVLHLNRDGSALANRPQSDITAGAQAPAAGGELPAAGGMTTIAAAPADATTASVSQWPPMSALPAAAVSVAAAPEPMVSMAAVPALPPVPNPPPAMMSMPAPPPMQSMPAPQPLPRGMILNIPSPPVPPSIAMPANAGR